MMMFSKLLHLRGMGHHAMHCPAARAARGIPVPLGGYGPFEHWDDYFNTAFRFGQLRPHLNLRHRGRSPGIDVWRTLGLRGRSPLTLSHFAR